MRGCHSAEPAFLRFTPVHSVELEGQERVDLTRSHSRIRATAPCRRPWRRLRSAASVPRTPERVSNVDSALCRDPCTPRIEGLLSGRVGLPAALGCRRDETAAAADLCVLDLLLPGALPPTPAVRTARRSAPIDWRVTDLGQPSPVSVVAPSGSAPSPRLARLSQGLAAALGLSIMRRRGSARRGLRRLTGAVRGLGATTPTPCPSRPPHLRP